MKLIIKDLCPAYIPFIAQCTKADGDKADPTVDNLIIYEEGGADGTFDSTQISGSPFDPAKVNSKTGLWGVLVDKTALSTGKFYLALWEMTVDSKTTAMVERFFCCNAAQFGGAGGAGATAQQVWEYGTRTITSGTKDSEIDDIVAKLPTNYIMGSSDQANVDTDIDGIKAKTDNLPADPADDSDIDGQLIALDAKLDAAIGYIDTEIATIDGKVDSILEDTGTTLDTIVDDIKAKTDQLIFTGAAVDANTASKDDSVGLTTQEKVDVNAEVDTALAEYISTYVRSDGTLTADGSEQTVYEATPTAVVIPDTVQINLTNMQAVDSITVRVYAKLKNGGSYVLFDSQTYTDAQVHDGIIVKGLPNRYGYKVTLEQTAGTNRDFDYERFSLGGA